MQLVNEKECGINIESHSSKILVQENCESFKNEQQRECVALKIKKINHHKHGFKKKNC
jgi:hypothetical protein